MKNPIDEFLILNEYYQEYLVAVPMEFTFKTTDAFAEIPTNIPERVVLVYVFYERLERKLLSYVYRFSGARII